MMASTEKKRVIFGEMFKSYANNEMIDCRFVCHDFTPTGADRILIYNGIQLLLTISVDDCPIVDSETGERSVRFSAAQLPISKGIHGFYVLIYGFDVRALCGGSTHFRVVCEDDVNRLEKKCNDSENTIRSQQELMSKTKEVKYWSRVCAELVEEVKGHCALNRRLLDKLSRSKGRVEELKLKSREDVLESREKTADQQVLITELNAIRSSFEAKLEESSASIAKVLSERRDIDSENKQLKSDFEDMKAQCDSLQAKTQLMMTEIMDFDKIKLKNKVQIKRLSEELKELRNGLEEMVRQKQKLSDEWKEREQSMANEWRKKECLFETQLSDMTSRLTSAFAEKSKTFGTKDNT